MSQYFFGILIVIGVILIIAVSLYPDKSKEKEENHNKKQFKPSDDKKYEKEDIFFGKTNYTWLSPNGSWITTKIFIVGIALLVIAPLYVSFKWHPEYLQFNFESIHLFFNTFEASIIPFNTWTKGDILFIIVYVSMLITLVNLPTRYNLNKKGISYGLFGLFSVSSHTWTNISCFDIDDENVLHIWFSPPLFKPDWSIKIPRQSRGEIAEILLKHSYRYSIDAHKVKNQKVFNGTF